jgi:hypothetical protein
MASNTNRAGSVKSFRNHDIEFQDVKHTGDSIEHAAHHHMNVGLSEDDMIFLENFPEEKRKKILRKVRVSPGCNSESTTFRVTTNRSRH